MNDGERLAIETAFQKYDANGNGRIGWGELRELCAELGVELSPTELRDALLKLDTDGSGEIELPEFVQWWSDTQSGEGEGGIDDKLAQIAETGKKVHFIDIHVAAWNGDHEAVERLLKRNRSLARAVDETQFGDGNTPLHYAAYNGSMEVCQMLLGAGAEVDAWNETHCTPLFYAAQQGHIDVAQLFKDRGAKITTQETTRRLSPMDVCKTEEMKELLLQDSTLQPPATPPPPIFKHVTASGAVFIDWEPLEREKLPVLKWSVIISEVPQNEEDGADSEGDPDPVPVGEWTTAGEVTEIQVQGLASGATYVVQIGATNTMGSSELSPPCEPFKVVKLPSKPSHLAEVAATATSVTFSWRASHPRGAPIKCYRVQSRHDTSSEYSKEEEVVIDGDVTEATVPVKRPGKTFFRVFGVNARGSSKPSNELLVMVPKPTDYGHGVKRSTRVRAAAAARRGSGSSAFHVDGEASGSVKGDADVGSGGGGAVGATPRSAHSQRSSGSRRSARSGRRRGNGGDSNERKDQRGSRHKPSNSGASGDAARAPVRPSSRRRSGRGGRPKVQVGASVEGGVGIDDDGGDVGAWSADVNTPGEGGGAFDDADGGGYAVNRLTATGRERLLEHQ